MLSGPTPIWQECVKSHLPEVYLSRVTIQQFHGNLFVRTKILEILQHDNFLNVFSKLENLQSSQE